MDIADKYFILSLCLAVSPALLMIAVYWLKEPLKQTVINNFALISSAIMMTLIIISLFL